MIGIVRYLTHEYFNDPISLFPKLLPVLLLSFSIIFTFAACKTATTYRTEADKVAVNIIQAKQEQVFGKKTDFSVERPSDILRRRLLLDQGLAYSGDASFGTDMLRPVPHWPEEDYPKGVNSSDEGMMLEKDKPLKLSLIKALQVGAMNSREYQTKKEEIFRYALDLDLRLNDFRFIFDGSVETKYTLDKSGSNVGAGGVAGAEETMEGFETGGSLGLSKTLYNGTKITTALALDIVNLLNPASASSTGVAGDASISIPLMRGSGKYIVTEPLKQAERNVVYAIYEFERYKKLFAVDVARKYLDVLSRLDEVDNAGENYRNLIVAARQTRRLADAGRTSEIDFDRADQNRLNARERWIRSMGVYEDQLDEFKKLIGLPVDANIELDRGELESLSEKAPNVLSEIVDDATPLLSAEDSQKITLVGPSMENAGPLEIDETLAIKYGLDNRLDLRISEGKVYDAQRQVVVRADALRAELTLFGSAQFGESRSLTTANQGNADIRFDKGIYTGLFKLDLPLERTAERNEYRDSFIALERAARDFQNKEDEIKLDIRNSLRAMVEARESYNIQTDSVAVAEKRLKSSVMFYESGRAELRDILDAQEDLVNAKNALTSAIVEYRVAELVFQRDTGLLGIDENGLFLEYRPNGGEDGEKD